MNDVPLSALLATAAENMANSLRAKLVPHPGERGTAREQIIRDFLATHLPRRFEVSTGFAFDYTGKVSRQLDIVIFDSHVCPRFELPGGKFLFPCEAIAAVGEVRSSLTSRGQFRTALENLASVKSLDRSANGKAYDSRYREVLDPRQNHLHQVFTFLLILGESMDSHTIADMLFEAAFDLSVEELPNVILALDRYMISYCCDSGMCCNPMAARGVAIQTSQQPFDVLLRFYLLLGQAVDVIRTASLPYWEYLAKYRDLKGMVIHSCVDDPPPYLGNWTSGD